MKKLFSMALALVLCLSLSLTAFATELDPANGSGDGDTQTGTEDVTPIPEGEDGETTMDPTGPTNPSEEEDAPLPVPSITITMKDGVSENHVYDVYQIFTGDLSKNEDGKLVLSNVKYGVNYGNAGEKVPDTELKEITDANDAEAFAKKLVGKESDNSRLLVGDPYITLNKGNGYSSKDVKDVDAGYYLIIDNTDNDPINDQNGNDHDAYSAYIVQVVGAVEMVPKSDVPTVDKQVYDDEDGGGWGETADHDINESFQFRLEATVPKDVNIASYDNYKLVFHDTMSKGVTFESIESVTVNGTEITTYTSSLTSETDGPQEWTITIEDLKTVDGVDLTGDGDNTIEVVYNAHLNAEAVTWNDSQSDVTTSTGNINKVSLEYSNEPYADGTGKTPEDTVYVFSFRLDNTKWANAAGETGAVLQDAGFTLFKGASVEDDESNAVKFYKGADEKYYVASANMTDTVTEIKSGADGKFSFYGLDAGTYVLRETTTPPGYNTCDDITIVISATHAEDEEAGTASVDLSQSSNMTNDVVNKSGTLLPETGGIGTTIFYVVGGILIVSAVILLIGKKRMDKKVK